MQKNKNIKLLAVLVGLMTVTTVVIFTGVKSDGLKIDKKQFTLDPQTVLTDVTVSGNNGDIHNEFSFQSGNWYVNSKYTLDQNMRDVFFSVLSQMEIRTPVSDIQKDSVVNFLKTNGYKVDIYDNAELIKTYTIGGNAEDIKTFVMNEQDVPYEIHLPGYQSYVAGIFNVPENDWRNRFVFEVNPISLKQVDIRTEEGKFYSVKYDQNQFLIDGVSTDSLWLASYMEDIILLQADKFIEFSKSPNYDSLIQTENVISTLTVTDVSGRNQSLKFYKRIGKDPFILGVLSDGSGCLFRFERMKSILGGPIDF